jgi:hypothetical protein
MRSNGASNIIIGHGSSEATPFAAIKYYDRDIQVTYDNAAFEITNGTDTNRHTYSSYDYSNNAYSLYIGTLNENNHDYGSVCHCALYLYALEVYESDVLVHNFIPYSNNDVACLKDTITNTIINITGDPATYYPSIEKIIASWYKLHDVVQPMQVSNQYSPTININQGGQGIVFWRVSYYNYDGSEFLHKEYVEDTDNATWEPSYLIGYATSPNGQIDPNAQNNITQNTLLYASIEQLIDIFGTPEAASDTTYTITAQYGFYGTYYAYKAFGEYSTSHTWGSTSGTVPNYIQYNHIGFVSILKSLKFRTRCPVPEGGFAAASFNLLGSNDNFVTSDTIYAYTGGASDVIQEVSLEANTTAYAAYRFVITVKASNWNPGLSNIIATGIMQAI